MIRIERNEDMSPRGRLTVILQDDGDVIVGVIPNSIEDARGHFMQSVEFCSVGSGGGRSPKTLAALRNLITAMEEDNAENPISEDSPSKAILDEISSISTVVGTIEMEPSLCPDPRSLAMPRINPPQDNGPGELEVGHNAAGEVVINLPRDMTGHIVFSPGEARSLGALLRKHAALAAAVALGVDRRSLAARQRQMATEDGRSGDDQ